MASNVKATWEIGVGIIRQLVVCFSESLLLCFEHVARVDLKRNRIPVGNTDKLGNIGSVVAEGVL